VVLGAPPGAPSGLARIGAMVEAPAFYPYLSGRDNLRVLARYAQVGASRVDAVLDEVDLLSRARDRVAGYSMGMRQRLGLAAALLGDPDTVILDEPANGLDPMGVHWLRTFLRRLGDEGRTVLVSSHQLAELAQTVDDVVVIHRGRLVVQGAVSGLTNDTDAGSLERVFLDLVNEGEKP
jgi:ABC-2 type transport system ATP-binding protein